MPEPVVPLDPEEARASPPGPTDGGAAAAAPGPPFEITPLSPVPEGHVLKSV